MFADPVVSLISALKGAGYGAGVRSPAEFPPGEFFVRVRRGGGGDDGVTDSPAVDFDVYGRGYGPTSDEARRVRALISGLQGRSVGGVLFDVADCVSGPVYIEQENPAVDRFLLTFNIQSRSREE